MNKLSYAKYIRNSLSVAIACLFLAACGQKGPLYLPETEQPTTTKEQTNEPTIHQNARTGQ